LTPDEAGRVTIRRAVLSVFDPTGLPDLGRTLVGHSVELWATEGTRRHLASAGLDAHAAEELTGVGSWFGGRIKTLHPGLLGGILAERTPEGERELAEHRLVPIDLVVVNFYPFARRFAEDPTAPDLLEMVDIGGVTLARAAAKNCAWVTVASDPADYGALRDELDRAGGGVGPELRRTLAGRAFARVERYDGAIARAFAPATAPPGVGSEALRFAPDAFVLRYGENPHQPARAYRLDAPADAPFAPWPIEAVHGGELSFNNLLDLDTALALVAEFPTPSAAVVKHATPAGVASGTTVREALERAVATDPVARYGCVVAVNRPFAAEDVEPLRGVFVDLLTAPAIAPEAERRLAARRKLKLVRAAPPPLDRPRWEMRSAAGRLLVQEADRRELRPEEYRAVTSHRATPEAACALDFAWRVVRHAKSNAVVLAQGSRTVGIGSGQPSRVKAVELACEIAGDRARGSVLASDAFFPFADGVEAAARAGVSAILQPGGSIRDAEVVAAAERSGIAMYLTGWRVFHH
jgi:phosphoribosylaminoimidazolecarboxamide formyltransferase / IMP cyclohydrolase